MEEVIERLLEVHDRLVRIAYHAGADLKELIEIKQSKDRILQEYDNKK